MNTYEIVVKPQTGFGTPLKGDTIFGHFCWQIIYDESLTNKSVNTLFSDYQTTPFAIFSSAYPRFGIGNNTYFAFKKPDLPADKMFDLPEERGERIERLKECKGRKWMVLEKNKVFSSFRELRFCNDDTLLEDIKAEISEETWKKLRKAGTNNLVAFSSQSHNSINRLTGTTGAEGFAPFTVEQHVYIPEIELSLFVGIDEEALTIDQVKSGLERIGWTGFGKDASTGLGRFELEEINEINLSKMGSKMSNSCYTLAPCVPEKGLFTKMFFSPFTRFGRHGDVLAKCGNPFKNPVIMADEGGVFMPEDSKVLNKSYIGSAVTKISKVEPGTVAQGYSLFIPVKVEV